MWNDLAGENATVAYEAVWLLAASPDQSIPFLEAVLRPAGKLDLLKIRGRIADLGDAEYVVRETASRQLAARGEDIESELSKARGGQSSPEVVRRIEDLLAVLRNSPSPDRRRELRSVWVLELIGTPTAEKVLAGLAGGDPAARLTREAKMAIERLKRR